MENHTKSGWGGSLDLNEHSSLAIKSDLITEYSIITELVNELKSEFQTAPKSCRLMILDHTIEICNVYLETLMNEEHHNLLASNAHRYASNLKQELKSSMALLNSQPDPDPEPVSSKKKHQKFNGIVSSEGRKEGYKIRGERNTIQDSIVTQREPSEVTNNYSISTDYSQVTLKVFLFGGFSAFLNQQEIVSWPKGKSKQLFKYLIIRGKSPTPKEILMELFWQNHSNESARNNLNVAIYSLRQSLKKLLPELSVVLFKDGCYQINPELKLWVDFSEFRSHIKEASIYELHGKTEQSVQELKKAEGLYSGSLLSEDSYCDWVIELQNQLREEYRSTLTKLDKYYRNSKDLESSIELNKKILKMDNCDENAHRHLMENYLILGQRSLALRQFSLCEESLKRELDLSPQEMIIDLYEEIKSIKIA